MTRGKAGFYSGRPQLDDPYFSSVSLLLRMDGSGSSFVDSSSSAKIVTAFDNAIQVASPSLFGNALSLNVATAGSGYLRVDDSDGFSFGNGDFTVEAFIRPSQYPGNFNTARIVTQFSNSASSSDSFSLGLYNNSGTQSILFSVRVAGASFPVDVFPAYSAPLTSFTHIAGVRSGGSLLLYANGSLIGSGSVSGALVDSPFPLLIGVARNSTNTGPAAGTYFSGYIDELRITKGVARYTGSTYQVPSGPFPVRASPPGIPTGVSATPGNGQASLSWTPPASTGNAPISDYVIQFSSDGGSVWQTFSDSVSPSASAVVSGLSNGTAYIFRVAAVNSAGAGAYSASSSSATPATVPPPPSGLSGVSGDQRVTLSWLAPSSNGGSAITDYAVQYSGDSGSTWTTFADGTSASTSATVTGLTNGASYVFRVAAVNAIGAGNYSDSSSPVTPAYVFSPSAVLLTSGTSYTVPAGATSMKAWAVGSGGTGDGWFSLAGNAGGVAYKTWAVSGGQSVVYSRSDSGNSTVTFGGSTITGNAAPRRSRSQTRAGFSGGDGGGEGGLFSGDYSSSRGGAVGGNGAVASPCGRVQATDVSGLFSAVALAGASAQENCSATGAFGSGGVSGKYSQPQAAGVGGGGVSPNSLLGIPSASPGVGAVVLYFS